MAHWSSVLHWVEAAKAASVGSNSGSDKTVQSDTL